MNLKPIRALLSHLLVSILHRRKPQQQPAPPNNIILFPAPETPVLTEQEKLVAYLTEYSMTITVEGQSSIGKPPTMEKSGQEDRRAIAAAIMAAAA